MVSVKGEKVGNGRQEEYIFAVRCGAWISLLAPGPPKTVFFFVFVFLMPQSLILGFVFFLGDMPPFQTSLGPPPSCNRGAWPKTRQSKSLNLSVFRPMRPPPTDHLGFQVCWALSCAPPTADEKHLPVAALGGNARASNPGWGTPCGPFGRVATNGSLEEIRFLFLLAMNSRAAKSFAFPKLPPRTLLGSFADLGPQTSNVGRPLVPTLFSSGCAAKREPP